MRIGNVIILILLTTTMAVGQTYDSAVAKATLRAHKAFAKGQIEKAYQAYKDALPLATDTKDLEEIGKGIHSCSVNFHREALNYEDLGKMAAAKKFHQQAWLSFKKGEPILGSEVNIVVVHYACVSAISTGLHKEAIPYLETMKNHEAGPKPIIYHYLFLAYAPNSAKMAEEVLIEGLKIFPKDPQLLKDALAHKNVSGQGKS